MALGQSLVLSDIIHGVSVSPSPDSRGSLPAEEGEEEGEEEVARIRRRVMELNPEDGSPEKELVDIVRF
jgi:hypothetical protein